jgi:D-glycero-D-manno-heptose 1,7-bisphosphate phosphatase
VPDKPTPLLFLDLDGTVRKGYDELGRWVNGPEDVDVFPEAVEMMRRWKAGGGRIIGVSNQGGVALGHLSRAAAIQAAEVTNHQTGHLFDRIALCTHHPGAEDPRNAHCWCRKPLPGLLIESAAYLRRSIGAGEQYWPHMALMVGDRPEDQGAAEAANVDFQWAADWRAQAGRRDERLVRDYLHADEARALNDRAPEAGR